METNVTIQRDFPDYRMTVRFDEDSSLVDVGGLSIPETWSVHVNAIDRLGWNAVLTLASRDGRPMVFNLDLTAFGGAEITSASLRQLPMKRIVVHALETLSSSERLARPERGVLNISIRLDSEGRVHWTVPAAHDAMAPRRGRRVRDEDIREVARVYREAMELRIAPIEHVYGTLHLGSKRTAARYVERARDMGYLGPAPAPRVAGEREV